MKFFKYLAAIITICLIAIQIIYEVGALQVGKYIVPSNQVYSRNISEVLWVQLAENKQIELEPTSALGYLYSILSSIIGKTGSRSMLPSGLNLSHLAARSLLLSSPEYRGRYYQAVAAIWISNHWTVEQTAATLLNNSYYGFGLSSFSDAAKIFFNKTPDQLTTDEIVTLISLWSGSSIFNPFCQSDKFNRKAISIESRLQEYWPEKYKNYTFQKPEINRPESLVCK